MKFKALLRHSGTQALRHLLVIVAVLAMAMPEAKAEGVTNGMMIGTFTNVPSTITGGGNSNALSSVIRLRGGEQNNGDGVGVAIWPSAVTVAGASAVSNVVFSFQTSADGATWSTTTPLTYTLALNGATAVVGYTNVRPQNTKYLKLVGINAVNTISNVTISEIRYSYFSP